MNVDRTLKLIFYYFMKIYMQVFIRLYFGRLEIVGRNKLPAGKPIIYSVNHQNAFMDALIIGTLSPVRITSMTRSDVFNTPLRWFMDALQMMPIYRMRDGIDKLALNEKIFEKIRNLLAKNNAILIFSEGNHGNEYFLRPLSKGSSRMALESLEKLPGKDIQVVPVGMNYFHHQRPAHKLTVVFGEPIPVKNYFQEYKEHPTIGANKLKDEIATGMKKCLILAENNDAYTAQKVLVNRKNESIPFADIKKSMENGLPLTAPGTHRAWLASLARWMGVFNFGPLLLLQRIFRSIKDIVFYGSLKFAVGLFVFPIWWLMVFGLGSWVFDVTTGAYMAAGTFFMLFVRQYLIRFSNQPHYKNVHDQK